MSAVALLPDGRIAVGGWASRPDNPNAGYVALLAAGRLDRSAPLPGYALATKTDPAGRLVITLYSRSGPALRRLRPDLTTDPAFAAGRDIVMGPEVAMSGDPLVNGLAIQPDGKVLLAAMLEPSLSEEELGRLALNANGAPDTSFGAGGRVTFPDAGPWHDTLAAIALQPDGKILLAGTQTAGNVTAFRVMRLTAAPAPDPSLGSGGAAVVPGPYPLPGRDLRRHRFPAALTVAPDGTVLVAAYTTAATENQTDLAVLHLRPDGTPDWSFGDRGLALTTPGRYNRAVSLNLVSGNKLLVTAAAKTDPTGPDFATLRLNLADPSPITTSVRNGNLVITGTPGNDVTRLAQRDGRLFITGVAGSFTIAPGPASRSTASRATT
ncbi:MAG: hypothetical protein QM755_21305 [Luteolibacter sp.]